MFGTMGIPELVIILVIVQSYIAAKLFGLAMAHASRMLGEAIASSNSPGFITG